MKSIRNQILIYLMIGSIVLFGLLLILSDLKLNELPNHIKAQYGEIVDARADEVAKELEGFVEQITIISRSPIIRTMDLEKIKTYLPSLVLDNKYRNMTIASPNGKAWSTLMDEFDISSQEQYKSIFIEKKKYVISQPLYIPYVHESDKPVLIVSHSINNEKNEVIGLVNSVINIEFLNQIVRDINLKTTGYGWIINRDGLVVAHPDSNAPLQKNIRDYIIDDNQISKISTDDSGVIEYLDINGEKMLGFFRSIENSPNWMYIISISEKDICNDINGVKNTIIAAIIIGLISVIIFSFFYSKSLSKPILELKEVFEKAANGNLNVMANEAISNELGVAAKSFNKMLGEIKDLTYRDKVTGLYNYNGFFLEIPHKMNKLGNKKWQYLL